MSFQFWNSKETSDNSSLVKAHFFSGGGGGGVGEGEGRRGRGGEEGRAGSSTNLKYVERPYFVFCHIFQ